MSSFKVSFALLLQLSLLGIRAAAPAPLTSANYTILQDTHDLGGGRSRNGSFTLDISLGVIGGISQNSSTTMRYGYAGQLNETPAAQPDSLTFVSGDSVRISTQALLSNDTDSEGDSLQFVGVIPPPGFVGQISVQNGWIVYSAPAGYAGAQTIKYTASDGRSSSATGTLTLMAWSGPFQYDSTHIVLERVGDSFRLGFLTAAGWRYRIETTEILDAAHPWQLLQQIDVTTTDLYFNIQPLDSETRFFRFQRIEL